MEKNKWAAILGSIKSEKKSRAARENGKNSIKPHFRKCAHFENIYPYKIIDNEWRDKFPVGKTKTGRICTYNPDYFCPTTGFYIEVATSLPNMSEQGWKWTESIRRGLKLKIFWWEGQDITERFDYGKKGGRKPNVELVDAW